MYFMGARLCRAASGPLLVVQPFLGKRASRQSCLTVCHTMQWGRGVIFLQFFSCEILPWSSVFSEGLVSFGCKKHCQSSKVRRISVVVENSSAHTPAYKVCPYRREEPDPMRAAGICYEIWGYLDKFLQWFTLSRVQDRVFWKNVK